MALRRRLSLPLEPIIPQCACRLPTPCLLVDTQRVRRNIDDMNRKMNKLNVFFRPHMKTLKSAAFAALMTSGHPGCGICVSTVAEARYFAQYGYKDMLYTVNMSANKVSYFVQLMQQHPDIQVGIVVDNVQTVAQVAAAYEMAKEQYLKTGNAVVDSTSSEGQTEDKGKTPPAAPWKDKPLNVMIEIDAGMDRAGLASEDSSELVTLVRAIAEYPSVLNFRGVLGHAGQSYAAKTKEEHYKVCGEEQERVVAAAQSIRKAGLDCPLVSVGSTPTAVHHSPATTKGVTEVRAGVYPVMDLNQAGIGSCRVDDIALTVLTTVIGHQPNGSNGHGHLIVDAGGLALSKDQSASQHSHMAPTGFGWVYGHPDLYVASCKQEYASVALREPTQGEKVDFAKHPIGSLLRILPNHACITAAGHSHYYAFDFGQAEETPAERWDRHNGFY